MHQTASFPLLAEGLAFSDVLNYYLSISFSDAKILLLSWPLHSLYLYEFVA